MALAHLRAAGIDWTRRHPGGGGLPAGRTGRARAPARHRVRQRADVQHGPAVRRGGLAGRRAACWSTTRPRPPSCWRDWPARDGGAPSCVSASMMRRAGGPMVADPGPVIRAMSPICVLAEWSPAVVAARFHAAVDGADRRPRRPLPATATGLDVVALGGGVFQNALLIDAAERLLADRGFTVLRPRLLPPNDGGIALGPVVDLPPHRREEDARTMCLAVPGRVLSITERRRHVDGRRRLRRRAQGRVPAVRPRRRRSASTSSCTSDSPSSGSTRTSAKQTLANFEQLGILEEEFGAK